MQEFMAEGEAEQLENAVIDAALEWTAAERYARGQLKEAAQSKLFEACRHLHIAREKAFTKKLHDEWSR